MTTLNTQTIISEIKSAFNTHVKHMALLAKESNEASVFNIKNVPELGTLLQQADKQVKYLESLKDAQALYDIIHNTFTSNDVENYEETEAYEQVCDIRSDVEDELQERINDEICSFLSKTKWQEKLVATWEESEDELGSGTVRVENNSYAVSFQVLHGYHLSQLNCEYSIEIKDEYLEEDDINISDAKDIAEDFAIKFRKENNEFISTEFNCSVNSQTAYIRHNKIENQFSVIVENDDFNAVSGYTAKFAGESGNFDTLEEVHDFLNQYYTDEYHDFSGLRNLLNDLLDD